MTKGSRRRSESDPLSDPRGNQKWLRETVTGRRGTGDGGRETVTGRRGTGDGYRETATSNAWLCLGAGRMGAWWPPVAAAHKMTRVQSPLC